MNERNGKQLIARTLKEYAAQEIPDNPNPWPDLRTRATLSISHTAPHPMLETKSEPTGVRPALKRLSTSSQRMSVSAVMVVLVLAAVAVFAVLSTGGRRSTDPVPAGAVAGHEITGAVPALTPLAELTDAAQMVGMVAPDASFTNVRTGAATTLSAFRGKAVLLTIWFTRCPACLTLTSNMQQVYDKYSDKVAFVSVSFGPRDNLAGVKAFVDQNNYPWSFLHASDVQTIPYPVGAAPTAYFIGSDGIVHDAYVGGMDIGTLVSKLDSDLTVSSNPTDVP